jgi:xanthine dehydrogenase iron-sulfur cluster and FAD-binding subunit A
VLILAKIDFFSRPVSVVNISSQETQKNPIKKEPNMARISLRVNGKSQTVETDPETPLLYVLRDDLKLNGPKFGCGLGQCGACTVIINGNAIQSCQVPVKDLGARAVTTLECLGSTKKMHPIQKAFLDEQKEKEKEKEKGVKSALGS